MVDYDWGSGGPEEDWTIAPIQKEVEQEQPSKVDNGGSKSASEIAPNTNANEQKKRPGKKEKEKESKRNNGNSKAKSENAQNPEERTKKPVKKEKETNRNNENSKAGPDTVQNPDEQTKRLAKHEKSNNESQAVDSETAQIADEQSGLQPKKEAYVNPNRAETGGQQRTKLTADELAEKMEKIRLKNAQIKERREEIEADKQAFSDLIEKDDARVKKQVQVQQQVNLTRDENARRKMERQANRAWDAEKPVQKERRSTPRGRGGNRGRGRGSEGTSSRDQQKAEEWSDDPSPGDRPEKPMGAAEETNISNLPGDDEWSQNNNTDWA